MSITKNIKAPGMAIECYLGQAQTGAVRVAIHFRIISGPNQGDLVRWDGWFTEKTNERTIKTLRVMGWNGLLLQDLNGLREEECASAFPNVVSLDIRMEEGKTDGKPSGKWYPRVAFVNDEQAPKEFGKLSMAEAAAFSDKLKGLLVSIGGNASAPRPTVIDELGLGEGMEDDLPAF
jgi:hypothetical protein